MPFKTIVCTASQRLASCLGLPGAIGEGKEAAPRGEGSLRVLLIVAFAFSTLLLLWGRLNTPQAIMWDTGVQMNSAAYLLEGRGLLNDYFATPNEDISKPQQPTTLTWFPPGFSLAVAGLRACGVSCGTSLRILYTLSALIGWIGWIWIFLRVTVDRSRRNPLLAGIYILIALLLPLAFTPWPTGTDIFLWAGTSWVILLAHRALALRKRPLVTLCVIGLLVGGLCCIRWAASFLALYLMLSIAQESFFRWRVLWKEALAFCAALAAALAPVILFTARANAHGSNNIIMPCHTFAEKLAACDRIVGSLSKAGVLLSFPQFETLRANLHSYPNLQCVLGLAVVGLFALLFCYLLCQARARNMGDSPAIWHAMALCLLSLSIIAFLIASMFQNPYGFLSDGRYYLPGYLSGVFLLCYFCHAPVFSRPLNLCAIVLLAWFAYYHAVNRKIKLREQPFYCAQHRAYFEFQAPGRWIKHFRKVFAYNRRAISCLNTQDAMPEVEAILKTEPEAVIFCEYQPYYISEKINPAIRFIPAVDYWKGAYTSKPLSVYWVLVEAGLEAHSTGAHIELPLLRNNPLTQLYKKCGWSTIYKTELPAGYRFSQRFEAGP